jgi:hypothetical protein
MDIWGWSQPLGLGTFILAMALVLFVLSWTVKTLATIPPGPTSRRR